MEIARRQLGENTRAVHLPPPPETTQRPLGTPIYRTAAWAFSSAQPPGYQKLATFFIMSAKQDETQRKRLQTVIDKSASGTRLQ